METGPDRKLEKKLKYSKGFLCNNSASYSPRFRLYGFRNPINFWLWKAESWGFESVIQLIQRYKIRLTIGIRNPCSTETEHGIQYLESRIHTMKSKIQDCLGLTQDEYFGFFSSESLKCQTMNRPSLYGMLVLHRAIDSIRSPINIYTQRWREIMFITFRLFVKAEMRDTPAPGLTDCPFHSSV